MKVLSQSYSPLCCSKPVWLYLFCGIHKEKFLQVSFFCVIIISEDWSFIGCKNIIKAIHMTNVLYFKHSNRFETLWEWVNDRICTFRWATLLTTSGSQAFEWYSGWHRCFSICSFSIICMSCSMTHAFHLHPTANAVPLLRGDREHHGTTGTQKH